MSRFKDLSPIHETEDYGIYVGPMVDPAWEGQRGYLLGNKRTGVVEGELSIEGIAIKTMREVQETLNAALSDTVDSDDDFDTLIDRMMRQANQDDPPIG